MNLKLNLLFKLSHLNSNFPQTLGYEQPGPGIVKKQTVDNVLDVIINFIYWEFHK